MLDAGSTCSFAIPFMCIKMSMYNRTVQMQRYSCFLTGSLGTANPKPRNADADAS